MTLEDHGPTLRLSEILEILYPDRIPSIRKATAEFYDRKIVVAATQYGQYVIEQGIVTMGEIEHALLAQKLEIKNFEEADPAAKRRTIQDVLTQAERAIEDAKLLVGKK